MNSILSIITLLGVASAAPQVHKRSTIGTQDRFELVVLQEDVHRQYFQASQNQIFAGLTTQNATCNGQLVSESSNAVFTLGADGSLYLYSNEAPYQQTYVDASAMGQGIFGYTTGAQGIPKNGQRGNFTLDASNHLMFNDKTFVACPYNEGHTIWVSTGVDNPAGNSGCSGVTVRASKIDDAASCTYSSAT